MYMCRRYNTRIKDNFASSDGSVPVIKLVSKEKPFVMAVNKPTYHTGAAQPAFYFILFLREREGK